MKAQFVFENIDFERNKNPRSTMDIGGVDFQAEHSRIKEETHKRWNDYLQQFVGKTITGVMDSWQEDSHGNWKEHTVKIAKIYDKMGGGEITVKDPEGNSYTLLTLKGKFIVESVNFERSGSPKEGLDIGGVQLAIVRKDIRDKAKKEWTDWLYDHLVGKTISGTFNQISKYAEDGMGIEFGGDGWGKYTIKVKEITNGENIEMDDSSVFVVADDNWQYVIPITDKKIWIKS